MCDNIYIGETERCIKNRLNEHFRMASSAVWVHMKNIHNIDSVSDYISWRVIEVERNRTKRRALESLKIRHSDQSKLMNGCQGEDIEPFLL